LYTGKTKEQQQKMEQSKMKKNGRFAMCCIACVLTAILVIAGGCRTSVPDTGGGKEDSAPVVPTPPFETFVWPYTGEETGDAFSIKNVPLSVKIENSAAARPQMGLNRADVIYETMVEGGETRFNCIFQSQMPEEIGPVRSARLSDLWIVPQYHSLFFFSGANQDVLQKIRAAGLAEMSHNTASALYRRVNFRSAPHNLYLALNGGHELAGSKGFDVRPDGLVPLEFGSVNSTPAVSAGAITLNFGGFSNIYWNWDAERDVYIRSQGGEVLTDSTDDQPVFTKNMVVLYADYTQQPTLDPAGSPTFDTTLGGTGKAIVFRNGKQYECTWTADRDTPPTMKDEAGNKVPLEPGRTWFEVLPARGTIKTE
jgi:hypothetical protein